MWERPTEQKVKTQFKMMIHSVYTSVLKERFYISPYSKLTQVRHYFNAHIRTSYTNFMSTNYLLI